MGKFFTFADRAVRVQFFEEAPVVLTLLISDETDQRILESGKLFQAADKAKTTSERAVKYRAALETLIGAEKTDVILARSEKADSFAIYSVYRYILSAYAEQKSKNLNAPAR